MVRAFTVRTTEMTAEGEHRAVSEEFAVLDRAGRLQLPKAHVQALDLGDDGSLLVHQAGR